MVFFYKIGEQESRSDSAQRQGVGEVAQIMYTHVSRCKNYKIKFKKRKLLQSSTSTHKLLQNKNAKD
jgi:hypothetical protein